MSCPKQVKPWVFFLLVVLFLLLPKAFPLPTPTFAQFSVQSAVQSTIQSLEQRSGKQVDYLISNERGNVTFLAPVDGTFSLDPKAKTNVSAETLATQFLQAQGKLFGISNPVEELRVSRVISDADHEGLGTLKFKLYDPKKTLGSMTHVVMDQRYNGIPVFAGTLVTHLTAEGKVKSLNGHVIPNLSIPSTVPYIDADTAKANAIDYWIKNDGPEPVENTLPILQIFDQSFFEDVTSSPQLSWVFDLQNVGEVTHAKKTYIVSAQTGSVLYVFERIEDALNRYIYDCGAGCQIARSEGDKASSIDDVNKAYDNSGATYNFYKQTLDRDGMNGSGGQIKAKVRISQGCPNAFAATDMVNFCPGFAELDVVAHELTHVFTYFTARLTYQGQSGAINEAMSDIMAAMTDKNWTVGETTPLAKSNGKGFLRNMADPPKAGHPDRVCSSLYHTSGSDNGGVHKNSGIPNKAAYLLSEGGTFNGCTVQGIGRERAAQIHYKAMAARYITASSQFTDYYKALLQACESLNYGKSVCNQVDKTLQAVEMHVSRSQCLGTISKPACTGDDSSPIPTIESPKTSTTPQPNAKISPTKPVPSIPPHSEDVAIWITDASGNELAAGSSRPKGTLINICYNLTPGKYRLTIDRGIVANPYTKAFTTNVQGDCIRSLPLGELASTDGSRHTYSLTKFDANGLTEVLNKSTSILVTLGKSSDPNQPPEPKPAPSENPQPSSAPGEPTNTPKPTGTKPPPSDNRKQAVQKVIDQVSEESIRKNLEAIADNTVSRYSGNEGNNQANAYIEKFFKDNLKLETHTQGFSAGNGPTRNVIAKLPGKNSAAYVVTGHMDSTAMKSNPPTNNPAPGADDNGSGTVAVMEAAKAFKNSGLSFNSSLLFITFSGEEQGLVGSREYVKGISKSDIKGAINLDMIGNNGSSGDCVHFGYKNYNGGNVLSEKVVEVNSAFNLGLKANSFATSIEASDHKPFWDIGVPAIFGYECDFSPAYHTTKDTIDKINISQMTKTIKAVVGALVSFAME